MPSRKAAAICYRLNDALEIEFLLVRNKSDSQWVFPKGTVEAWEPQGYLAAVREAWEEAGARGRVEPRRLGTFRHEARLKRSNEREIQQVEAYLMLVIDTQGTPEPGRRPTWFSVAGAQEALLGKRAFPSVVGEAAQMLQLAQAWLQKDVIVSPSSGANVDERSA